MKHYHYKCNDCSKTFSAETIELHPDGFQYLCPACGKSEKNTPLQGVLRYEYDLDHVKRYLHKDHFLSMMPGKFGNFASYLPLQVSHDDLPIIEGISEELLERVSLGGIGIQQFRWKDRTVYIQDETRNPTLSFKDRATIITAVKALQLGITEISAASTGNAGSSLAGICARLGMKAQIFVPERIPDAKRIQIQSFGANIYLVQGSYDDAFDASMEIAAKKRWFSRNTAHNPLTIEGKKWGAFDMYLSSGGALPDKILVPVGDGVIIAGLYKGFSDLKKLGWIDFIPALIAVQAKGSNALARYLEKGTFEYQPANTIADSISAGAPSNLYMAAEAVRVSGGRAVVCDDTAILDAQKMMAQQFGILAEPSCAVAFAGYLQLTDEGYFTQKEKTLLLITGNGLKDVSVLSKWNEKPPCRTGKEWFELICND